MLFKKLLHFSAECAKIKIVHSITERVNHLGIFSFNRQNKLSVSPDWKLFTNMFHQIGAFIYREPVQTAFFDDNAQRILGIPATLSKEHYQTFRKKLSESAVEDEQNLYLLRIGAEKHFLRMQITHRNNEEIGFIEELSNRLPRITSGLSEYDTMTNMLNFPAFSGLVQQNLQSARKLCLAAIRITGLDKIADFSSGDTHHCMASVAEVLNRFSDDKIIFSVKGFQEFYACFINTEEQSVLLQIEQMRSAVMECTISDDFGQSLQSEKYNSIDLHAGLAFSPSDGSTLRELMTRAEFALFETKHDSHHAIIRFSNDDFERKKDEYREEQLFDMILRENQFTYHFQPIVDAHTGKVVGYETLMRPEHFSPGQMLNLAEKYGRLYEIEKITLCNALKFLSEHQQSFSDKKLFINSIPASQLSESDFNELRVTYEDLFGKIVIEIIEQSEGSEEMLSLLKRRCQDLKSQLAIDDYGSGYANTATLLKNMPQYVKIDIALISDICKNAKKQQLVAGIIDYAHENQITVLAEGVESEADMKTLIRMGVDLIQGFYTAKPKPFLLEEIPKDVRDTIINTNLETSANQKKIYHVHHDEILNLVDLALQNYTDIHIYRHQVTIIGDPEKIVPMHITIVENHSCELHFRNVNLTSKDKPCISIGSYAQLTLILEGSNSCDYTGIHVPEGAFFRLQGSGNLKIDCYAKHSYGIGSDCESSYGCITLESTGRVEIIGNGDRGLGIGGGFNPDDSEIRLESGNIFIHVCSPNSLGIGSCWGNSLIYANSDCMLTLDVNGISGIGMGSFSGESHINCSSALCFNGSGKKIIGIGVLDKGQGDILIADANLNFYLRTNIGTCIGAIGGDVNVRTSHCQIEVNAEGGEITSIGDATGNGDVSLEYTELKTYISATKPHEAGSASGKFSMKNSSIIADVNDQHNTQKTGD